MLDLTGKVAFVAGAGSVGEGWGNGKATAVLLARQGAKVYGVDLNPAAVAETAAIIEAEGDTCATRTVNMTVAAEVAAAVEDCLARFGRIDILVNNVGGSAPGDPVTMPEEVWDAQMDHNLKTAFLGCKYVLPVMERQGAGAVVNLSSVACLSHQVDGRTNVAYAAVEGRGHRLHPQHGDRLREEGHPGELRGAGHHAHAAGGAPAGQAARRQRRRGAGGEAPCQRADGADGRCLGHRPCGAVLRLRRGEVHHRDASGGGWRADRGTAGVAPQPVMPGQAPA